jgi:hypothetical protein
MSSDSTHTCGLGRSEGRRCGRAPLRLGSAAKHHRSKAGSEQVPLAGMDHPTTGALNRVIEREVVEQRVRREPPKGA